MANAKEELEALEAEVQRIRAKKNRGANKDTIRKILNTIFMMGALVGVIMYFMAGPDEKATSLGIIGASMFVKVMEFILRFTA